MTPSRTQTRAFLFADLRGYSAYTERRGDGAAAFTRQVGNLRLTQGICGEQSRAWQEWAFGVYAGKLLCYSASETFLEWTFGEEPILMTATRRGGDFDEFMAWWSDIGRLLSR